LRTGAAYLLKNLSKDHPDYRELAYTLLANAIRDHSKTEELTTDPGELARLENDRFAGKSSLRPRAPDLYAALRVLMEREELPGGEAFALGLPDVDLRGAVILNGDFRDADLRGARLDWANARPDGADSRCAFLQGANLFGAHLENSDFRGAQLDASMMLTPKSVSQVSFLAERDVRRFDDLCRRGWTAAAGGGASPPDRPGDEVPERKDELWGWCLAGDATTLHRTPRYVRVQMRP
jgi:hypothetical protein